MTSSGCVLKNVPFNIVFIPLSLWFLTHCSPVHPPQSLSLLDRNIPVSMGDLKPLTKTDSILADIQKVSSTNQQLELLINCADKLKNYNVNAALVYADEACLLAIAEGNDFYKAQGLYYRALLNRRIRLFGESIEGTMTDAKMCYKIFHRLEEPVWVIKTLNLIGLIHYSKEANDSARIYLLKGLSLLHTSSLTEEKSMGLEGAIFHDLGNTYFPDSLAKALSYYDSSRSNYRYIDSLHALSRVETDMSEVYISQGDFESAEQLLQQNLTIDSILGDQYYLRFIYENLGDLRTEQYINFKDEKFFDQALSFYWQALKYNKESTYSLYERIGRIFQLRAYFFPSGNEKDVDSATVYYYKAVVSAGKEGAINEMPRMIDNLANLCKATKICDSVIGKPIYQLASEQYTMTLDTTIKNLKIANTNLVDFARSEVEGDAERKRFFQLLISTGIITTAGFIFIILFQQQERKKLQNKMIALRAQMNPHFFSNSLNAILNLIYRDNNEDAAEYLIQFERLARGILDSSFDSIITLEEELNMLTHYLELEQLRLRDKLIYQIKIDEQIDQKLTYIPALIIQPYVENAIEHGLRPKKEEGKVEIQIEKCGKYLCCAIEDNGIGRKKSAEIKQKSVVQHRSLGMKITEDRIKAINKGKGTFVKITDLYHEDGTSRGTRVDIRLTLTHKKQ